MTTFNEAVTIYNDINDDILLENLLGYYIQENKQEYEEEMKRFFPTIYNELSGIFQFFLPMFTKVDMEEQAILNKYIKGLKFETRLNNSYTENSWTIPAITSATAATVPGIFGIIYTLIKGIAAIEKNKRLLKAKSKNGIITFPPSKDIKILTWHTKGLVTSLTDRERVAVFLHEVGHWHGIDLYLKSFFRILTMVPAIGILFLVIGIVNARKAEWHADGYTHALGYGPHLKTALEKVTMQIRPNVNWYIQINDFIKKIFTKINNVIDIVFPISTHPSVDKRTKELEKSKHGYGSVLDGMVVYNNQEFILEGVVKEKLHLALLPFTRAIDKVIGKNMKKIFNIEK